MSMQHCTIPHRHRQEDSIIEIGYSDIASHNVFNFLSPFRILNVTDDGNIVIYVVKSGEIQKFTTMMYEPTKEFVFPHVKSIHDAGIALLPEINGYVRWKPSEGTVMIGNKDFTNRYHVSLANLGKQDEKQNSPQRRFNDIVCNSHGIVVKTEKDRFVFLEF